MMTNAGPSQSPDLEEVPFVFVFLYEHDGSRFHDGNASPKFQVVGEGVLDGACAVHD